MLKLLLDEHISHDVARGFRPRFPDIPIFAINDFEDRRLAGIPDNQVLSQAWELGFTLVTYDTRTIPPILKGWAASGRSHAGIIFVDEKTIRPGDFGGLIRALGKLALEQKNATWQNRIWFLKP